MKQVEDKDKDETKVTQTEVGQWAPTKKLTTEIHHLVAKFTEEGPKLREAARLPNEKLAGTRIGYRADLVPARAYMGHDINQTLLNWEFNQAPSILGKMKAAPLKEARKPKAEVLPEKPDKL